MTRPQNEHAGNAVDSLHVIGVDAFDGADDNDVRAELGRAGEVQAVGGRHDLDGFAGVEVVNERIVGRREWAVERDPNLVTDVPTTLKHCQRELTELDADRLFGRRDGFRLTTDGEREQHTGDDGEHTQHNPEDSFHAGHLRRCV